MKLGCVDVSVHNIQEPYDCSSGRIPCSSALSMVCFNWLYIVYHKQFITFQYCVFAMFTNHISNKSQLSFNKSGKVWILNIWQKQGWGISLFDFGFWSEHNDANQIVHNIFLKLVCDFKAWWNPLTNSWFDMHDTLKSLQHWAINAPH